MFFYKQLKEQIKEAFYLFDTEKSDQIDYVELKTIIKALGFDKLTKEQIYELARNYDVNSTGRISFTEYHDISHLISD